MTVYLDDVNAPRGGMLQVNMIADTDAELHAMAGRMGVARRYHQGIHYAVCATLRDAALRFGAVPVTWRQCELMLVDRCRDRYAPLRSLAAVDAHLAARAAVAAAQNLPR